MDGTIKRRYFSKAWPVRGLELTFGEKVLILYFTAFYFVPIVVDFFVDLPIKYILQGDLRFFGALSFSVTYLIAFLFVRRALDLNLKIRVPGRGALASKLLATIVFLLFLIFSARFSIQFTSSFRHAESYSSAGLIPILTFALKTVCSVMVFASISTKRLVRLHWYHFTMYLLGVTLSFVGAYDIVYFVMTLYAWFRHLRSKDLRYIQVIFSRSGGIAIILLLPGVVFAGMANKIGFDRAVEFFSDGALVTGIELFANRTFYHSYSLAYQLNHYFGSVQLGFEAFNIVTFQSLRRLLVLVGFEVPNETLQTVSRLNFLIITGGNINSDAGASPGLLGSIFYLPGGIYILPLHMLCLYNAVGIFDNIMGKSRYGSLAYICGIILLQALTDAFMDNLNPFSIGFIALTTMFIMSSHARTIPDPGERHH
jgi:hypothetical protein